MGYDQVLDDMRDSAVRRLIEIEDRLTKRVLAALESAPDAGQVSALQQRLAVEYDGRVAAEGKLGEIRKLIPDWYDPVTMCGSDIIAADDLLDILDGDA